MKDHSVLFGSLAAGLLASACCIGPLVLAAIGLGSLGLTAWLAPLRPWFPGFTATFLAVGFYLAYRPLAAEACAPGQTCAAPVGRRPQQIMLWLVTFLSLALATYPSWGAKPGSGQASSAPPDPSGVVVTLDVQGMTCNACAAEIEHRLREAPGVVHASVDYGQSRAEITVAAGQTGPASLIAAVEKAGYHATVAAAERPSHGRKAAGAATDSLVSLETSLAPLIADFDVMISKTRFMAVLSPRCPACVHGAAAIKQALLDDKTGRANLVLIVWTPMVAGDDESAAKDAMTSLRSSRVRHYYDPGNQVGRLLRRKVFPDAVSEMQSSVPHDHFIADALRGRPSDTPEWDIYMFFSPGIRWGKDIPRPSRWVRQVARFAEPGGDLVSLMWQNSYRSPPIEGDLAKQISILAAPSR